MRVGIIHKISFQLSFLVGLSILTFLIVAFSKDFLRWRQINNELEILKSEIVEYEKKNVELTGLIEYFDSAAYTEQKARQELGYKRAGEEVVIIQDEDTDLAPEKSASAPTSNFVKWWRHILQLK